MKQTPCCPTCGRNVLPPKLRHVATANLVPDLESMMDAERFAYFKKTADREDLAFLIRFGNLSPALLARAEATTPTKASLSAIADMRTSKTD